MQGTARARDSGIESRLHFRRAGVALGFYTLPAADVPQVEADCVEPAVIGCVRRAFDDLDSKVKRGQPIALAAASQDNR